MRTWHDQWHLRLTLAWACLAGPLIGAAEAGDSCMPAEDPCGLAVEAVPPSAFEITWQDSIDETSYRLERKKGCCRPFVVVDDAIPVGTMLFLG